MNVLEEVESEVNHLAQTEPIKEEVKALDCNEIRIKEITCYRHDLTADLRGYSISILTDELIFEPNQMKSILNIKGLNWISASGWNLKIDLWRKEI